jgi:uncharacterized protein (DUF2267 family)
MNEDTMLNRLRELAPFADREDARRAFDATLLAMRRGLNEDEADWLAVALGPTLATPLLREMHQGELSADELYRWTKRYGKIRKGMAVERAQVVCRALAELLREPEIERLRKHLPEISSLLEAPEPTDPPSAPRPLHSDDNHHTLAGGRLGSTRPLSEAGAPTRRAISGAKPEIADAESVAHGYDPHNDTTLDDDLDDDDVELDDVDGAALDDTTPDEGRVGANGAFIPKRTSRPLAPARQGGARR